MKRIFKHNMGYAIQLNVVASDFTSYVYRTLAQAVFNK